MANGKYIKLFEPAKIGKVQLKNRFVKTAAQTYLFDSGEHKNSTLAKAFLWGRGKRRRGAGDCGDAGNGMAVGGNRRPPFRVDDDKYINDIRELTDAIINTIARHLCNFITVGPGEELWPITKQWRKEWRRPAVTLGKLKSVF